MSPYVLRPRLAFSEQTKTKIRQGIAITTTVFFSVFTTAQEATPAAPQTSMDNSTEKVTTSKVTASVPAGTRIGLVLTQPIQTRYIHRGDDIYAQITSPVTSGNEVVIPAGGFVQGKVDKVERQGGRGELRLQSLAITFADGYVANVSGPVTLETDDGYAIKDPGKSGFLAVALPAAGVGLGALIGHAAASSQPTTLTSTLPAGCTGPPPGCLTSSVSGPADTGKNVVIGAAVGGAVGAVVGLTWLLHTRNFFVDAGSPVSMVLHEPIVLPEDEVEAAIRDAEENPAPEEPTAPPPQMTVPPPPNANPGICWTPGSPGTPDVDIPGTPAVGGSPGTPPIHIPGIPATPPTAHPCP